MNFLPCTSSDWWKRGDLDPVFSNLCFDGEGSFTQVSVANYIETVNPADPACITGTYLGARRTSFWEDDYSEPHWDRVVDALTFSGQHLSQVFLHAQDGWLSHVSCFFPTLAASGDVTVHICHVDGNEAPDLQNIICTTTFHVADIQACFDVVRGEHILPIDPCFLSGGKRYAVVFVTGASHFLNFCDANLVSGVLGGHHWYMDVNGQWVVDTTRSIIISFGFAVWAQTRYEIQLNPLTLVGGITSIDILHEGIIPNACNLSFQVKLNNKWYPLDIPGQGPDLSSAPTLLQFRAVLTGTLDLMPGFGLTSAKAQIKLSGPSSTSFVYLTTTQTPPSSTANVKVTSILEGFDSGHHTYAMKLISGGTHVADSVVDTVRADGSLQRDCIWTTSIGGGVASYVLEADGGTDSANRPFKVSQMTQLYV